MTTIIYYGFGFPLEIVSSGEDPVNFECLALDYLLRKSGRYAGSEIKFVYQAAGMTPEAFCLHMEIDAAELTTWEEGNSRTGVQLPYEKYHRLRQLMLNTLGIKKRASY